MMLPVVPSHDVASLTSCSSFRLWKSSTLIPAFWRSSQNCPMSPPRPTNAEETAGDAAARSFTLAVAPSATATDAPRLSVTVSMELFTELRASFASRSARPCWDQTAPASASSRVIPGVIFMCRSISSL